ncbi:hypothetical protein HT031_002103 [Scenedesmus sp. PABB004]|nr:hypothetical protein HT031_002103 [Scenedesmus sp. PABB004]
MSALHARAAPPPAAVRRRPALAPPALPPTPPRARVRCAGAALNGRGGLTASEISRGITNTDLHLRQHVDDDHINWDANKEESRVWRRTMFTFPDWKRHRSSYRYVHHVFTILESRIVRGLLRPVAIITAFAVAVGAYHSLHAAAMLPALLPPLPVRRRLGTGRLAEGVASHAPRSRAVATAAAATAAAAAATTTRSYGRWNEGRRSFGRITTTCRDICRQMLALIPRDNVACRGLMARWLVAFVRCSKWYIREDEPLEEELRPWLEPRELKQLVASPHPPNFAILVLSHAVANSGLQDFAVVRLEEGLSSLSQSLSACDRLLNTPIPLSYTRHTARFLILWLLLLPLALWGLCGWGSVPMTALIAFVLLGIEEIGVSIEEPFSILALEQLCKKAERHISGMMLMDETTHALVQRQQAELAGQSEAMSWKMALDLSVWASAAAAPVKVKKAVACQNCPSSAQSDGLELYGYEVVAEYPHDARAFTQGLQYDTLCSGPPGAQSDCRAVFWESTGMYGHSNMRLVDVDTGAVLKQTGMGDQWFGEGATRLGNRLYQITWQTNTGFIYSVPDLKQLGTFSTPLRDGWGITTDDKLLVLSDGSDTLTWVDPAKGFAAVKRVVVNDGTRTVEYLNELEMIGGELWANVWQTNCIARICPESGRVKGWLLMQGLRDSLLRRNLGADMDVLNGIAWDHQRQRLFVTGKYWPRVFEVVPQPLDASDPALAARKNECYLRSRPYTAP